MFKLQARFLHLHKFSYVNCDLSEVFLPNDSIRHLKFNSLAKSKNVDGEIIFISIRITNFQFYRLFLQAYFVYLFLGFILISNLLRFNLLEIDRLFADVFLYSIPFLYWP